MGISFAEGLLLFGGLLAIVAALSGVMKGTVLSASVLSVVLVLLIKPRETERGPAPIGH